MQIALALYPGFTVLDIIGPFSGAHRCPPTYGPAVAQTVQLAIEYDPQPPFDAGSRSKAPAEIVELAMAALDAPGGH